MYRLLEVGEVIENGDEYYGIEDKWLGFPPSCLGMKSVPHDAPIRRLVKGCKAPAVTPAASSVPDPGDGWRLLKPDELVQQGDQYYSKSIGWIESDNWRTNGKQGTNPAFVLGYRRRVPPVVSVGDRVKVLSGPWAGCTGVVLSWSVEITITGGEMKARTDSQPVVRLDHVWVGGQRLGLTLGAIDVEKLTPVVPEVLFRDLSHGETIRQGDQIRMRTRDKWEPACMSAGSKIGSNMNDGNVYLFRRPVRIQSPGWRYLDAGETIARGDQWVQNGRTWGVASVVGEKAEPITETGNVKIRRKLPANQGG